MASKTAQFSIRIPVSVRLQIEELAAKEHRSLANQILCLLETALSAKSTSATKTGARHPQEIESGPSATSASVH